MRWLVGLLFTTIWLFAVITGQVLGGAVHLLALAAVVTVLGGRKRGRLASRRRSLYRWAGHDGGTARRSLLSCALLVAGIAGAWVPAEAMRYAGFGAKAGLASPERLDGTVAIGAHAEFAQPGSPFHFVPGVMYWNSDGFSDLNVNADVSYHFLPAGTVTPYLGAGLGVHAFHSDRSDRSDSDLGANLFGGLQFPSTTSHFFIETRLAASDVSHVAVLGGVTFHR